MRYALRPYVTAGIAITGAGIIALSPISAPPPGPGPHSVEFSTIDLSAAVQPFDIQAADVVVSAIPPELSPAEAYQYLLALTGAFLSDAVAPMFSNPIPILSQVLANQFAYLNYLAVGATYSTGNLLVSLADIPEVLVGAAVQLASGDAEAAIVTLWDFVERSAQLVISPWIPALQIPVMVTQNIANVAAVLPNIALGLFLDTFETMSNTVRTTAASAQSIIDAAGSGNPLTLANAIARAPADIANAFLIGDIADGGDDPGLINGVIKHLVLARETIAEALGAPPREIPEEADARAAKAPDAARIVSTGSTGSETESGAAASDESAEPAAAPDVDSGPPAKRVRNSAKAAPGRLGLTTERDKPAKHVKSTGKRISSTADRGATAVKPAPKGADSDSSGGGTGDHD